MERGKKQAQCNLNFKQASVKLNNHLFLLSTSSSNFTTMKDISLTFEEKILVQKKDRLKNLSLYSLLFPFSDFTLVQ